MELLKDSVWLSVLRKMDINVFWPVRDNVYRDHPNEHNPFVEMRVRGVVWENIYDDVSLAIMDGTAMFTDAEAFGIIKSYDT